MKKVILVDGNNLMFRSYYATAYSGNIMRNSKGFPTNGLFGFVNMITKIMNEEKPEYIMVAFDIGKTFRHEKYKEYKGGRIETPEELKIQFPVAKEILTKMGIKYIEVPGYEADDIIGTYAKKVDENPTFEGLIVSSDKDLLQLISKEVKVKLLKTKDYIMMDEKVFKDTYGVEPIRMTDLKGLMGDSSDNIPGVKGIGEKTAIKLLTEYNNLENLYSNIDNIKGATQKKLLDGKEDAFKSREIATIFKDVPIDYTLEDLKYEYNISQGLIELYKELEFNYFINKLNIQKVEEEIKYKLIENEKIELNNPIAIYLDLTEENYHKAKIKGLSIYDGKEGYYIKDNHLDNLPIISSDVYTYDAKKLYVSFKKEKINIPNISFDLMIACYLLNYNVKEDISSVATSLGYSINPYNKKEEITEEESIKRSIKKAKMIYEVKNKIEKNLEKEEVLNLFYQIEMPLSKVLAKMELNGIRCDKNILDKMGEDIQEKVKEITNEIYKISGTEFNISSPKQLGQVLFETLNLPYPKKKKTSYSTDEQTLSKLKEYPIVQYVLTYRMLTKLYSTYIEGLKNSILEDGKIHTIYTQTLTRTGRLSSIEPNLQNIPVRSEYGRLIRKCFIPEENSVILSSDYSQIELRIFASLAHIDELIHAFKNNIDIHKKTASDVYKIPLEEVTSNMRRNAKAVNFGIIYGISSYGLAEDLNITPKEAKDFIDSYFQAYPGIKKYMEEEIKKAKEKGYVKTIMNRKRVIEELNNTNYMIRSMGERMALNTPIQGSSADILKKAMIEIDSELEKQNLKSTMLLQIHDELVFNVKNDELEKVKELVKNIMEKVVKIEVPLTVDINIGNNLYEAK